MAPWSRNSKSSGKDGVWTHRYSSGEVRDALKQASKRDLEFFRVGGKLRPANGDPYPPK